MHIGKFVFIIAVVVSAFLIIDTVRLDHLATYMAQRRAIRDQQFDSMLGRITTLETRLKVVDATTIKH